MPSLKSLWRRFFDIREGETGRTVWMSLYLMFVLFAYYIVKTASRSVFLNSRDIQELPVLYVVIAVVGGLLSYVYTRTAIRTSLMSAVTRTTIASVASLLILWFLLGLAGREPERYAWVVYVFNVWTSLFGVVLVTQGWLVAANVFDSREAKRLYGILGSGAIIGAGFGGAFTAFTVRSIGTNNLLFGSMVMVGLAYGAFRLAVRERAAELRTATAVEAGESRFSARDILAPVLRYRHLQVIIAIVLVTYIVDTVVDYQWSAAAKAAYQSDELTAFLGKFFGIYLNLASITFQFFLTSAVVRLLGVGGTLQILPSAMIAANLFIFAVPGLLSTSITRLIEAAMRYSLNRTGMELLFLPLPTELKNRTKAFIDIFVDRAGRGVAGVLLIVFGQVFDLGIREVAFLGVAFAGVWLALSIVARREYVRTIRKRLEARRLDLESVRVRVEDPAIIRLLEETAMSPNPRQATYALDMLAEARGYDLPPLLRRLAGTALPEVRAKIYDLAAALEVRDLASHAEADIVSADQPWARPALPSAVRYVLRCAENPRQLLAEFLEHPDIAIAESALEAMSDKPEDCLEVITRDWLARAAEDSSPERRALAANAIGVRGDQGTEVLFQLLSDQNPRVVVAACRAAGRIGNRNYLSVIIPKLASPHTRGAAIEALAAYGQRIEGSLGDTLADPAVDPGIRRQVPRALAAIGGQKSVTVLLGAIEEPELSVRLAVYKALLKLRQANPELDFGPAFVNRQILAEARQYFALCADLQPLRESGRAGPATRLLMRTIEERLRQTIDRMFRLLGLRYPPKEIYAAYLALNKGSKDRLSAALEFLDNVLDRELKKILLPLLDDSGRLVENGRALFGIAPKTAEQALGELIGSRDPWLVACAIAAAGELKLRGLVPEIERAGQSSGGQWAAVARSALVELA